MTFPADYFAARSSFREASQDAGLTLESHAISSLWDRTPIRSGCANGQDRNPIPHQTNLSESAHESLTIDVAVSSTESARAVIITSGLHGVEGFIGSAIQTAVLKQLATVTYAAKVRLVLVHALNPWGFANLRRVDAENVDLNRNFLLPGEAYSGSPPLYSALDRLLNPPWPHSRWEPFLLKALLARLRYGIPALKHTIAFGQYDFPRGLYFGGKHASETVRVLQSNLQRWVGNARSAVVLDFHTGLGAWGNGTLLLDAPIDARVMTALRASFGEANLEVANDGGVAFAVRGSLGPWCAAAVPSVSWLYLCAEFGTYPLIPVLTGLRAENQQHHFGKPSDEATVRAKERLRELFFPAAAWWRERVLFLGLHYSMHAIHFAAEN